MVSSFTSFVFDRCQNLSDYYQRKILKSLIKNNNKNLKRKYLINGKNYKSNSMVYNLK